MSRSTETIFLPRQQQDQHVALGGPYSSQHEVSWEAADLNISMLGSV